MQDSMAKLCILSSRSIDLPCLLKTIILVFFWLIFNFYLLTYFPNLCKVLFKPASVSERINKSSTYIKQLMSFCCNLMGSQILSLSSWKISLTNKLNNNGLKFYPCLTPNNESKKGVTPSLSFTGN